MEASVTLGESKIVGDIKISWYENSTYVRQVIVKITCKH